MLSLQSILGNYLHISVHTSLKAVALALLLQIAIPTVTAIPAEAASAVCRQLTSQLASLGKTRRRSSSSDGAKVRSQSRRISVMSQQMKRRGCSTSRFRLRSNPPGCRGLRSKLRQMKQKLRFLKSRSGGTKSRVFRASVSRSTIERRMRRNGCGKAGHKNSGDLLNEIFAAPADAKRRRQARLDRRELQRRSLKDQRKNIWSTSKELKNHNTYRTVCVRRCDGYYFPVSFSTDEGGLERDAAACANLCPGTDMELFSHKTSTETTEQMVSIVDGTLYTAMNTAFKHREKFDPKCACDFSLLKRKYNIDRPDSLAQAKLNSRYFKPKRITLPSWRKVKSSGTVSVDPSDSRMAQIATRSEKRRVRVIGDAFFPTQ